MTIDIAGLPREHTVFEISPLAELGVALHALSTPGHHPGLHGWVTATTAGLCPDLADRLHEAEFLWQTTHSDVLLPFAGLSASPGRPGATLAEELDLVDRLDDERFAGAALDFTCGTSYGKGGDVLGDPVYRDRTLALAAARGPQVLAAARQLLEDLPAFRAWLRRFLEDCDEAFFADAWRRVAPQLAADARHKAEILRHKGLAEALHAVSPAVSVDEGLTRITVDKLISGRTTAVDPAVGTGLTLVPSTFGWPHLLVLQAPGWRPVIHYPVGGPEFTGPGSVELLKLRMEALAHPMRIQLCRNLARTPYTTSELAEAHGITAPEVSRHLAVLKKAGVITTRRRGRYVLHQLDVAVVARLGSDFLEAVLR
ncbi:DUF5937 family protein [Streptomyces qinzhouensis]|uniref:DUF5937 family protein n=1 Tax=Streptomyces qinzhouensis TaxID=2599401 RepID=UPI00164426AF|nr:DUF5937 family protein [Streptomyces qinzhouensis]